MRSPNSAPLQAGVVQHFNMLRHRRPECCAVGGIALLLAYRYDLCKEPLPDVSTEQGLNEL